MSDRTVVPSADFIRNIGYWQNEALRGPVYITHHGRARLVLAAPDAFHGDAASNDRVQSELTKLRGARALISEHLEGGFIEFNADARIVLANKAFQAFMTRSAADLIGRDLADIMPDAPAQAWASAIKRVLHTHKTERIEMVVNDSTLRLVVFPLPEGVGTIVENLTELRGVSARLAQVEATQTAIAAHAAVASVVVDVRGLISSASDAFCSETGLALSHLVGTALADLVAPKDRKSLSAAMDKAIASRAAVTVDATFLEKSAEGSPTKLSIAPVIVGEAIESLVIVAAF